MKLARGSIWPILVTAALLFTVGANVVMFVAASSDRNGSVVEPDYYRKGVEWDRTMARRAESARLGWRATAALSALRAADPADPAEPANAQPTREVAVTLRDSTGVPVRGAELSVVLIHNSDAAHPVNASLTEKAPGVYTARLSLRARGRWEVRVEASRAESRFGAVLHAEAP